MAEPPDRPRTRSAALVAFALAALVLPLFTSDAAAAADAAAVGVGLCGAFAAYLLVSRGFSSFGRADRAVQAGGAFVSWCVVSAAFSGRVWPALVGEPTSMIGAFTLVSLFAITLAAASAAQSLTSSLARTAIVVVGVQAVFAAVQLASSNDVRGLMPNSTYFGEVVVLLTPFMLLERRAAWREAGFMLAPIATMLLAAGGSRAAAAAAVLWMLIVWIPRAIRARRAAWAFRILLAVAAFAMGATFASTEFLPSRSASVFGERAAMWQAAGMAAAARPLVGYGPDGFIAGAAAALDLDRLAQGLHLALGPGAADPHNALAWVAASTGIVGVLLFAWFVVMLAPAWRDPSAPELARTATWGVVMAFWVFLTAPAASQVLPLFALVLGTSLGSLPPARFRSASCDSPASSSVSALRGVPWLLAAPSVLLVCAAATRLPFEAPSQERSPTLAPFSLAAARAWRVDPHLWHLASLHTGWSLASGKGGVEIGVDLACIRRACEVDTRNPVHALELARTLIAYGSPSDEIEAAFSEAFRRWPAYPLARAERALWLAKADLLDEARIELTRIDGVLDLDPVAAAAARAAEREILH